MRLRSEYFPVSSFRNNLVARSLAQGTEASRRIARGFFVGLRPCGTTREFGELPEVAA